MDYLRAFQMVVVSGQAFSLNAIAMIETQPDGWDLKTNTGEIFNLTNPETTVFRRECQQGVINASPEPFAFLRQRLNWIVMPNLAINLNAIMVVQEQPEPFRGSLKIFLFGGWQVNINPIHAQIFQRECQNLIFEAQKLASRLQAR